MEISISVFLTLQSIRIVLEIISKNMRKILTNSPCETMMNLLF